MTAVFLALSFLSGCDDPGTPQRPVEELVHAHMPVKDAARNLTDNGFFCRQRDDESPCYDVTGALLCSSPLVCTRREGGFLHTCNDNVRLFVKERDNYVDAVQSDVSDCSGGYSSSF